MSVYSWSVYLYILFGELIMLIFYHVEKEQNFIIYLVLTIFGVCGVITLVFLRPFKEENNENDEVCWEPFSL